MKVYGYKVSELQQKEITDSIYDGITAMELVGRAKEIGVPDLIYNASHYAKYLPHRVVDRILQKERKAGNIEFKNNGWHRVKK